MGQAEVRGVIFDSDGTLVDTERISTEVLCEVLVAHGIPVRLEDALAGWSGVDLNALLKDLSAEHSVELPDDFLDGFRTQQHARLEREVQPIAGAHGMLSELELPRCVASNAPVQKVSLCLRTAGLMQHFDERQIHSAYQVGVWKPAPDLFLHAARALDLEPRHCLVVEDSAPGVDAGIAAGMRVLALDPRGEIQDRPGMERIRSLGEVLGHTTAT